MTLATGENTRPINFPGSVSTQTVVSTSTMIASGADASDVELRMNIDPTIGTCHLFSIATRLSSPVQDI